MARKVRIEDAGFHHVVNRGVNRGLIFNSAMDKEKFLEIVCEVSTHYDFIIHGFVLMDNHYHLLLENERENLSHGMRQINATYAQYYNKKYKRTGHLWQGRFKSWYVFDENYLFMLFKYLEFNPIDAKISKKAGEYSYTLLHDIIKGSVRPCMRASFILEWYDSTAELLKALGIKMSCAEYDKIERFQKDTITHKSTPKRVEQKLKLDNYFHKGMSRVERNDAILKANQDGFMQSEIAKFLNLTEASVSTILKKLRIKL